MKARIWTGAMALAAVTILAGGALAGPAPKLTAKDLPPAVTAALQQAYPHAVIQNVDLEHEGDATYFEVETKDGDLERDLLYTADGTLYEYEEAVAIADLPEAVTQAVAQAYPEGKIDSAARLWRGAPAGFELDVTQGESVYELAVDADGTIRSTQEELSNRKKGDNEDEDEDDDAEGSAR